jgi:predicted RND superfamily exporter protein
MLEGDLVVPPSSDRNITLPGNVCDDFGELLGSPITLSTTATNLSMRRALHTILLKVSRTGSNIIVRLAPTRESAEFLRLAGHQTVHYEIAVRTQLKPEMVAANKELASFVRARRRYGVGGVIGPYEYLTTTRFMLRPDDPAARELSPSASANLKLWGAYGFAAGVPRLRQLVDADFQRSLTTVFLKDANFRDSARLMAEIRDYETKNLAPKGIKLGFAGDVAISQSLIRDVVATQVRSLIWSLAGILIVTALLGGSLRWGFYCTLPSALAVLIKLAVMGWLGIPLGVATSMFAAMTFGIGINCSIQLLESYAQAKACGIEGEAAVNCALAWSGPPALVNTLAMSLGFSALMLSQFPANARLGLLLVVGLIGCMVASLFLLPVLLHWWPVKTRGPSG